MNGYDVFLSHSSHDNKVVKDVLAELRSDLPDVKYWVDFEALQPGDDWSQEIIKNASGASLFLIFGTSAAFKSNWVQYEIALGLRNHLFEKAPIVILAFDVDAIPEELRRYQYINFENYAAGIDTLKKFVSDQFSQRRPRMKTRDAAPYVTRGTVLNYVSCPQILSGLSKAELRRRICKKLNRPQVSVLWFDVLESAMDDELPGQPIQNCVMELILRADKTDRMPELFDALCKDHPTISIP